MTAAHPHYVPVPYQDSAEGGRLILRDGTTATVRLARPDDHAAMTDFFRRLSKNSRRLRFFSLAEPNHKLIEAFCDDSDQRKRLCLVVTRAAGRGERIIASANYVALDETSGEIAFAVDDAFQGKGIASLLLERLAVLAARNGFHRLCALTLPENQPMLEIFRASGFEFHSRANDGVVEIDISVTPSQSSVERAEFRDRVATAASLRPFFQPAAVAVVGASRNPKNIGTRVLQAITSAPLCEQNATLPGRGNSGANDAFNRTAGSVFKSPRQLGPIMRMP